MDYIEEMRAVIDEFPDRVLLGEVQSGVERIGQVYGNARPRFHFPRNFMLLDTQWDVASVAAGIDQYLNSIPDHAWPVWILGSHDKPRIVSKLGLDQARVAAMLLFTLPRTPIFHPGDEIGKPNGEIAPDRVRDPFERLVPGWGLNRDPERTPRCWDAGEHAGFTTGEPWLPIGHLIEQCNVASQQPQALNAVALSPAHSPPVARAGAARREFEPQRSQRDVLLFERRLDCQRLLVALNIGPREQTVWIRAKGEVQLSTHLDRRGEPVETEVRLRAAEGVILRLG